MNKRLLSISLLSILAASVGTAFGDPPYTPGNPEKSFTPNFTTPPVTRAQALAQLDEFRLHPVTPDNWQYVGGEKGYAMIPEKYEFHDGKFLHSDNFDYSTGKAGRLLTPEEKMQAMHDYKP